MTETTVFATTVRQHDWTGLDFPSTVHQTTRCHPIWSDDEVIDYMVAETIWGTTHTRRAIAASVAKVWGLRPSAAAPAPVAPATPANIWTQIRRVANDIPAVDGFTSTYFAVKDPTDGDKLKFYRLDRPVKGKWAGYAFLKVQASDNFFAVRNPDRILNVLRNLMLDLEGALAAYGKEFKRCGICHHGLTVQESRDRGIGPVCAGRMGL